MGQSFSSTKSGIDDSDDFVIATSCFCNDETIRKETPCVICGTVHNVLLGKWEREYRCCRKITAICGFPEFVCDSCADKGWYSTAGQGGGTQHINDKTVETKSVKKYI